MLGKPLPTSPLDWCELFKAKLIASNAPNAFMASITSDGSPRIQKVSFFGQMETDPNILIFTASGRNPDLMSVIKGTKDHQLFIDMDQDSFIMAGRVYLVGSSVGGRFGHPPRKIGTDSPNYEEFWENYRRSVWTKLDKKHRAKFAWPASKELISDTRDSNTLRVPTLGIDSGYKVLELDAIDSVVSSTTSLLETFSLESKSPSGNSELVDIHNSALDNFCLMVFKPTNVDHVISDEPIPKRFLHCAIKGGWEIRQVTI